MDNEKIFKIWDELSDFGSNECDQALNHLMQYLCELISADNAFWVGSVRIVKSAGASGDPMFGWRIGGVHMLNASEEVLQRKKHAMKSVQTNDPGVSAIALVAGAGSFRAYTLHDAERLNLDSFKKTEYYDYHYRKLGVSDRIWLAVPVSADAESIFMFDKCGKGERFSERDLELASFAMRGIKWFHRQLLLSYGLGICMEPITVAERRVKQSLLSGASEKEIAKKLGLTPGTVHQYAVRIYRKFGVNGRTEFMSLWLNGGFS